MKRYIITFLVNTFFVLTLFAQSNSNTYISFIPTFGPDNINLSEGSIKLNDNLEIEVLKFYISGIQFLRDGKVVFKEENSFHLIDASEDVSLNFIVPGKKDIKYDQVQFHLGIDSTTNVSGALGGDLDPTKGMYWAWHSGYINLKLEGRCNYRGSKDSNFQYHLGGYQYPNNALQTITLDVNNSNILVIMFDLKTLFDSIDINRQIKIMSPGTDAVKLSNSLANSFKLLQE